MPRKRTVAATIAAAAFVGVPALDAATRRFMRTQPEILLAHGNSRRAIVYLTGVQNDAELQSRQLRPFWQMHGDVLVVQYPRTRFSATEVVRTVYDKLRHDEYDEFVVIAVSFSARIALDLIDYNNQQHGNMRVAGLILADPVMDASDVIPRGMGMANIWAPGALSNLGTRPFWMLFGDPLGECEAGADAHLIMEAEKAGLSWPLSGYRDQVRTILKHKPLAPGSYGWVPAVMLRSDDDKIIKPSAAEKWEAALGGKTPIISVWSAHAAFLHFPSAWQLAFSRAFRLLPLPND